MPLSRTDMAGKYLELAADIVVACNLVQLGIEAEYGMALPFLGALHHVFCGLYLGEVVVRAWREGKGFFKQALALAEVTIIGIGIVDTWFLPKPTWLWTLTGFRAVRFARVWEVGHKSSLLRDLWLVLGGLSRSLRSIAWVGVVLLGVTFSWGGAALGLIAASPPWHPADPQECYGSFSRSLSDCEGLDTGEYFGNLSDSMLTMLQLVTLDHWASRVIRPMSQSQPAVAVVLLIVVVITSYGLLSIAVGVMVCSTVELARTHKSHWSMIAMAEDLETIEALCGYFDATLRLEDRTTIDQRVLQEAMPIPQVAEAFRQLELPVSSVEELFHYLDKERVGEITLDEFQRGLQNLKQPASRFDVACLAATVGGQVALIGSLEERTDASLRRLVDVSERLRSAFAGLSELAGSMSQDPEVKLRRLGKIQSVLPPPPRYTC